MVRARNCDEFVVQDTPAICNGWQYVHDSAWPWPWPWPMPMPTHMIIQGHQSDITWHGSDTYPTLNYVSRTRTRHQTTRNHANPTAHDSNPTLNLTLIGNSTTLIRHQHETTPLPHNATVIRH
jgi:transposase